MRYPLDKLFKEKLTDHTLTPPAQAWTRVRAGLSKKNKGLIGFRTAAVVLLLSALATTLVWLASRSISTYSPGLTQIGASKMKEAAKETRPSSIENKKAVPLSPTNKRKKTMPHSKTEEKVTPIEKEEADAQKESLAQDLPGQAGSIEQPARLPKELKIASQEKVEKPVVIEYRLETIGPSPEPSSVAAAKEKSGFRKAIDFALEAKNSNPLGDLREAKDGLFAFNFKKEKQTNAK